LLSRFRRTVLSSACAGRLTQDWRAENPDAVSVEGALAARQTLTKRRANREQQVDLDLPELPFSYLVGTIGDAAVQIDYGTSRRVAGEPGAGVPILGMTHIQDGRLAFDPETLKTLPRGKEIEALLLRDGDILFNRTNSPELVGKTAVFRGDTPASFASYLIRVRLDPDVAEPDFVSYWLNSAWGRLWARHAKTDGVSQSNINGSKLSLMPLPLPPIAEQREIVRRCGHMLRAADRLAESVAATREDLDLGWQALIARVFGGDLRRGADKPSTV